MRRWARSVGLVKDMRPTNYFTNFTLTMLVVCFLQSIHMLPSYSVLVDKARSEDSYQCRDGVNVSFLHNINNMKPELNQMYDSDISLSSLLRDFFIFYAQFDFSKNLLCPIHGSSRVKSSRWVNSSCMDIINPLEPNLNVSFNISNKRQVEMFQVSCRSAIKKLKLIDDGEKSSTDGLFWLFENKETVSKQKRVLNIPSLLDIGLGGEDKMMKEEEQNEKVEELKNVQKVNQRTVSELFNSDEKERRFTKTKSSINEEESRRLEKLKVKYLRGSTHSKFDYKM